MSEKQLKACPFCGGDAEMYYPFHLIGQPGRAATYRGGVQCKDCGCRAEATNPPDGAIAVWNRRELESASQPGGGEAIREALATYETMRDAVGGCSDGGCIVKRPIGMHTNGGCKCHKDTMKAARMMWAGQQLANALRAAPSAGNGGGEG